MDDAEDARRHPRGDHPRGRRPGGADLSGADFSGDGVTIFSPAYQGSQGIDVYDLLNESDRVIAFDYDADRPTPGRTTWSATAPATARAPSSTGPPAPTATSRSTTSTSRAVVATASAATTCPIPPTRSSPSTTAAPATSTTSSVTGLAPAHLGHREEDGREQERHVRPGLGLDHWHRRKRRLQPDQSRRPDHRLRLRGNRPPRPPALLPPRDRPVWILEKDADQNGNVTFTVAFASTNGIGGYPLGNAADQIVAVDYGSTRRLDHLALLSAGHRHHLDRREAASANGTVTFALDPHLDRPASVAAT